MTTLSQDLRFSLRMLLNHKGFTIVSALTLALGIGVNTAMFSVLNTFLFGSLPYPQSEQLVRLWRIETIDLAHPLVAHRRSAGAAVCSPCFSCRSAAGLLHSRA